MASNEPVSYTHATPVRVVLDASNGYDDAELEEILGRTDYESRRALVEAYRELLRVYKLQRTFRRPTM